MLLRREIVPSAAIQPAGILPVTVVNGGVVNAVPTPERLLHGKSNERVEGRAEGTLCQHAQKLVGFGLNPLLISYCHFLARRERAEAELHGGRGLDAPRAERFGHGRQRVAGGADAARGKQQRAFSVERRPVTEKRHAVDHGFKHAVDVLDVDRARDDISVRRVHLFVQREQLVLLRAKRFSAVKACAASDAGFERKPRQRNALDGESERGFPCNCFKTLFQQIHHARSVSGGASAAVDHQEFHIASFDGWNLSVLRGFQCKNVELPHAEKRFCDACGFLLASGGEQFAEPARHDLPREPKLVLQPAALFRFWYGGELLPIVVDFRLRIAHHHERERLVEELVSADAVVHRDELVPEQGLFRVVGLGARVARLAGQIVVDIAGHGAGEDALVKRECFLCLAANLCAEEQHRTNLLRDFVGFKQAELPVQAEFVLQPDVSLAEGICAKRHHDERAVLEFVVEAVDFLRAAAGDHQRDGRVERKEGTRADGEKVDAVQRKLYGVYVSGGCIVQL